MSNQSLSTYLGPNARNGETDIFLAEESLMSHKGIQINDNNAIELMNLNSENMTVLSKSLKSTKSLRLLANEILGF